MRVREFIEASKGELESEWERMSDDMTLLGASAALGGFPSASVSQCFRGIVGVLNGYWADTYWSRKNYQKDRESALQARRDAIGDLRGKAKQAIERLRSKEISRLEKAGKSAMATLQKSLSRRECLVADLSGAKKKVSAADEKIRVFIKDSAERISRARRFGAHLRAALKEELNDQCNAINAANDPVDKFSRLCFAVLLGNEHQKLGG